MPVGFVAISIEAVIDLKDALLIKPGRWIRRQCAGIAKYPSKPWSAFSFCFLLTIDFGHTIPIDIDMPSPTTMQADEHTRLLSNDDQIPSTTEAATAKDKVQLRTQLLVILFVSVLYFNTFICLAPEVSIREEIICKAYYDRLDNDEVPIAERDCTVDAVQRELGLLNQVYITIAQLPGKHQSTSIEI